MDLSQPAVIVSHEIRLQRKLILLRAATASDYWAYCDEKGCEVYDWLLAIPERLAEPMGIWLPKALRAPHTSEYVMAVEVSQSYPGPIPVGMETLELDSTDYLVFQGQPYPENEMGKAISKVQQCADEFNPEGMGWRWSNLSPRYQFAPVPTRGYIEGRPVEKASPGIINP